MARQVQENHGGGRLGTWALFALVILCLLFVFFALHPFRAYLWSIGRHWVTLMSGIVSLSIAFYEQIKGKLDERLFYLLAILIFIFAGFQAWKDEYSKTHPGVVISVDELSIAEDPVTHFARVFIIADVANKGAPTIIDHWRLQIRIPGRERRITLVPLYIDPARPLVFYKAGPVGKPELELDSADALYNKTKPDPVRTGAEIPGVLGFRVPGISRRELERAGTVFSLSGKDIFGNVATGSYVWTGKSGRFEYVPGLKPPRQ